MTSGISTWVAKWAKPGWSNGFWVWTQCVYLKVSVANFLLFIGQTKCYSTDTAKKCGIQRNPRLAPVVNDGSVKWHKEKSRGPSRKGLASCFGLTLWERKGLLKKYLAVLNCSKSHSGKLKGKKSRAGIILPLYAIGSTHQLPLGRGPLLVLITDSLYTETMNLP